ncbi:hypothetical protein ASE36_03865 [Rhizobium sp. Root274]|uniref:hypothetical protein n=1 Tax=unclassified Rhizobium TaxID=2613769 RepID=UPI0007156D08|nr:MULTISPECIES: hypothetical protein [unclassified Rhizobium]KQW31400.1 hypothetical protein ASC71_03870 [Rhizobium sp. Root1240]KRD32942.1 hypothetical protein ASE36_03865 [Rhizobium sp. Root274]
MGQWSRLFAMSYLLVMMAGFVAAWLAGILFFVKVSRNTVPFEKPGETLGEADSRIRKASLAVWKSSPWLRRVMITGPWVVILMLVGLGLHSAFFR